MIAFSRNCRLIFLLFFTALKPQQTTSPVPHLSHDVQLLLAGSEVTCCQSMLCNYLRYCYPRKMLVSGGERGRGTLQREVWAELPPCSGFGALVQQGGRWTRML